MSEYLWDRSGEPDSEIQHLERQLAPLGLRSKQAGVYSNRNHLWRAVAAIVVLGAVLWQWHLSSDARRATQWFISDTGRHLLAGESIRANESEPITVEHGSFGRIELRPGSELRVLSALRGRQRMWLHHGEIHALMWSPPGQFVVDTSSARAIDLGCQYNLSVQPSGDGFLQVQTGWVVFQAGTTESFIPAGAACRTTRADGPGIPWFEEAPEAFRTALADFERQHGTSALKTVLSTARPEDGLTLWHLLGRVDESRRPAVFDRFAELVPLSSDVNRQKALQRDPRMLDLCWNSLGLSDAEWWRQWKRSWN